MQFGPEQGRLSRVLHRPFINFVEQRRAFFIPSSSTLKILRQNGDKGCHSVTSIRIVWVESWRLDRMHAFAWRVSLPWCAWVHFLVSDLVMVGEFSDGNSNDYAFLGGTERFE